MSQQDRNFPNTRAALEVYDAGIPIRDAAWNKVESDADVFAAGKADQDALALVQSAFYEDTKDINSRANCSHIHITDARRMIAGD